MDSNKKKWDNTSMIKKLGDNKYQLMSQDGTKNLGVFSSMKGAQARERQVRYFKSKGKKKYYA